MPILLILLTACHHHRWCDDHTDCWDDEICNVDVCEPIFERDWAFEVDAVSVGALHPDGWPWDTDLSAPDLYVEFGFEDDLPCITSQRYDEYDSAWFEVCDFSCPAVPTLYFDLWDFDGEVDEYVTGFQWEGRDDFAYLVRNVPSPVDVVDQTGSVWLTFELWPY